ncbi:MAG: LrgB family protein [Erysipelotrichales bacterium]|nr:LrgB family protein [Erysipelotrichales bacterium]
MQILLNVIDSPLFGIFLTIVAYYLARQIYRKFKSPLFNPLLLSIIFVVIILLVFQIDYETYALGGDIIRYFIGPATVILGISVYQKRAIVKKYWPVVLASSIIGAATSLITVWLLAQAFLLESEILYSLLPKSVTAAIAVNLSEGYGGLRALTVICVAFTGIVGAILNPIILKKLKLKNKIATGLSMGVSSHVIGTARAKEIGEVEGALSSVAIATAGFITALIYLFF